MVVSAEDRAVTAEDVARIIFRFMVAFMRRSSETTGATAAVEAVGADGNSVAVATGSNPDIRTATFEYLPALALLLDFDTGAAGNLIDPFRALGAFSGRTRFDAADILEPSTIAGRVPFTAFTCTPTYTQARDGSGRSAGGEEAVAVTETALVIYGGARGAGTTLSTSVEPGECTVHCGTISKRASDPPVALRPHCLKYRKLFLFILRCSSYYSSLLASGLAVAACVDPNFFCVGRLQLCRRDSYRVHT